MWARRWHSRFERIPPKKMAFTNQPLSNQGRPPNARILFLIFFLFGGVMFYFFFMQPALRVMAARHWVERPCRIVSSEVGSHPGSKGTTYSIDIVFRYMVGDRLFTSRRYGFMGGASSGYDGKEAVVSRYPVGSERLCYVNPANPPDAVLERGFTADMGFGAIPLVFMSIGAVGLVASKKKAGGVQVWNAGASGSPECAERPTRR